VVVYDWVASHVLEQDPPAGMVQVEVVVAGVVWDAGTGSNMMVGHLINNNRNYYNNIVCIDINVYLIPHKVYSLFHYL
jgi:hypothetical protein